LMKKLQLNIVQTLLREASGKGVDMGCGWNYIKKLPHAKNVSITGVDPISQYADVVGEIGDTWCDQNLGVFDFGFALNSLHFGDHDTVLNNIDTMMSLLKSNSPCYITLNQARITRGTITKSYIREQHSKLCDSLKLKYNLKFSYLTLDEGTDANRFGHHHLIILQL
jgi:hypothetical protein